MGGEGEVALHDGDEVAGRLRLAAQHDQTAGHVVQAVTVLPARQRAAGVLVQAGLVTEPDQMGEARAIGGHVAIMARAAGRLSAKPR